MEILCVIAWFVFVQAGLGHGYRQNNQNKTIEKIEAKNIDSNSEILITEKKGD